MTVSLLDLIIPVIIAGMALRGFKAGVIRQIVLFSGFVIGLIGGAYSAPYLTAIIDDPVTKAVVGTCFILLAGLVGGSLGEVGGRCTFAAS